MPKLTKQYVESIEPLEKKNLVRFDDKLSGFGVRVMPSGRRFYLARYRNKHGRARWFTIGEHGKVTPDFARAKAKQVMQAAADGRDPAAEREAFRVAPTVNDLLDRYLIEHVYRKNRPATQVEVKRIVERYIRPELGQHMVAAVTRHDVAKMQRTYAATPRQANIILAFCSKAFGLAELWEMRPEGSNPCSRIERYPESQRERFLSAEELGRLGATLRQAETEGLPWRPRVGVNQRTVLPRVVIAAIELLLFTGCRLSEVLNLRWDRVDLGAGTISLRETETKAGRPQIVTINAGARQVLITLSPPTANSPNGEFSQPESSPWVLPTPADPRRPLSKITLHSAWARKIRVAAGIPDVRLHDLRHTVGTYAGQSGANAFLVRDLLRHATLAMTGRYVNHADNPVRALSDQVGQRIAAGLAGRKGADVISLRPAPHKKPPATVSGQKKPIRT